MTLKKGVTLLKVEDLWQVQGGLKKPGTNGVTWGPEKMALQMGGVKTPLITGWGPPCTCQIPTISVKFSPRNSVHKNTQEDMEKYNAA